LFKSKTTLNEPVKVDLFGAKGKGIEPSKQPVVETKTIEESKQSLFGVLGGGKPIEKPQAEESKTASISPFGIFGTSAKETAVNAPFGAAPKPTEPKAAETQIKDPFSQKTETPKIPQV